MRVPRPSFPVPRRVTLRTKLLGLLGGLGVLVVAITAVGLVDLGRLSQREEQTSQHVTRPLSALGRARSLVNENATLAERHILEVALENKVTLEGRIAANDRAIDRQDRKSVV